MTNIIKLPNQTIRRSIIEKKMELIEVKHMAELEHEFKSQCQNALKRYKAWHRSHSHETDSLEIFYGQLRGVVLKRQALDAVQAYWMVRHDFRAVFQRYLNDHKPYKPRAIHKKSA